jgi:hypothetical protein
MTYGLYIDGRWTDGTGTEVLSVVKSGHRTRNRLPLSMAQPIEATRGPQRRPCRRTQHCTRRENSRNPLRP